MDSSTAHFGVFKSTEVIGILSIYRVQNKEIDISGSWQLRAMAITESERSKGHGFKLLREAESYASSQGGMCIWANARSSATGFYEKSGFSTMG
ncbi:MAG: GNAT family N-acetyltransferase, partial [Gammaproteobacteria bacterium]|nr:GNAT family N-acetyltransferase [Gammaproteobacteria bacterium]